MTIDRIIMRRMPICLVLLILIFTLIGCGNSKNLGGADTKNAANSASQTSEQSKLNDTSMTYLTYTNARFAFSLSYPDIYTVKTESDNGDGITMKNENKQYSLKIWGANNVNHETGANLLVSAKTRVSHIVSESADTKTYQIEYGGGDVAPLIFDEIGCTVGDQVHGFIISYPEKEKETFQDIVTKMSAELMKNATVSVAVNSNEAKTNSAGNVAQTKSSVDKGSNTKTSSTASSGPNPSSNSNSNSNSSSTLVVSVGKTAVITLDENITTGYSWHYVIENTDLIKLDSETSSDSNSSANSGVPGSVAVGAGGKHTWNFKGLKAGTTKITFKYYPGWLTEKSAVNTLEYTVKILE